MKEGSVRLTVRELVKRMKYWCQIRIEYYSHTSGQNDADEFYCTQYENLLFLYGNRRVDWFYVVQYPSPLLVIEIV